MSKLSEWRKNIFPPSTRSFDWKIGELKALAEKNNKLSYDILINTTPVLLDKTSAQSVEIPPSSEFPIFNPSVIKTEAGFLFSLRESNFVVKGDGKTYDLRPERNTINRLVWTDDSLNVARTSNLDDSIVRTQSDFAAMGIEDIRLFSWNNEIHGIGAGVNKNPASGVTVRQIIFKLTENAITEFYVLPSPTDLNIEKNWSPLVSGGDLHLVYSLTPLVIYKFVSGNLELIKGDPKEIAEFELRGGTPFVNCGDQFLSVAHIETFMIRGKRYGRHVFVTLDRSLDINAVSDPFFIRRKGVEFACGAQVYKDKFILSYGVSDTKANYSILDLDKILSFVR